MTLDALVGIADPLDRAHAADRLMWDDPRSYTDAREARRQAVLAAVEVGRSPDEIATRLRVRADDLDLLTRAVPVAPWHRPSAR